MLMFIESYKLLFILLIIFCGECFASPIEYLNIDGSVSVKSRGLNSEERHFFINNVHLNEICAIDLGELGGSKFNITRRKPFGDSPTSSFEIFYEGRRLTAARWPEVGYIYDIKIGERGKLVFPENTIKFFHKEPNLWIGGYWKHDWAYETSPVKYINVENNSMEVAAISIRGKMRDDFPYFLINSKKMLSNSGQYFLNENSQIVYVVGVVGATYQVATKSVLFDINGKKDLTIYGLNLENSLGTPLVINNSNNITIDGCRIVNSGGDGIVINGGSNVTIKNCHIENISGTAIRVSGGGKLDLRDSGHKIVNSVIKNFGVDSRTYHPGIFINGIGVHVIDNVIEDSPHSAIIIKGNNNIINGNIIKNVAYESDDVGAIYAGRDITDRGNVIKNNIFINIGNDDKFSAFKSRKFVSGIYLDDGESGFLLSNNVFKNVGNAITVHGGGYNKIIDNLYYNCRWGGLWFGIDIGDTVKDLMTGLNDSIVNNKIWMDMYPDLFRFIENRGAVYSENYSSGGVYVGCPKNLFGPGTNSGHWPSLLLDD